MNGLPVTTSAQHHFVPSSDVMTSIVLPTIVFCVGMVVAMLVGINKCKQWELDKVVEIRRTRRVIQRITARLREKNFRTIQKARNIRNQRVAAKASRLSSDLDAGTRSEKLATTAAGSCPPAPPFYSTRSSSRRCGVSPPPTYEDSLLDQLYHECMPPEASTDQVVGKRRRSSANTDRRSSGGKRQ